MSGLGFYLHNTDTAKLSVSLGPGYRISERQPTDSEFPSLRNYEVIATSTLDGSVSFSETFSVGAVVDVAHGEENTHYNTKAYVKNILMGSLALVFDVNTSTTPPSLTINLMMKSTRRWVLVTIFKVISFIN